MELFGYAGHLFVLSALLIAGSYWHQSRDNKIGQTLRPRGDTNELEMIDDEIHDVGNDTTVERYNNLRSRFLVVYGLAVAADSLQGSFLYTLYKLTHHLPESAIAALFATGFLCGGVSASFVGELADRFGRKRACLAYCALYSLSCSLVVLSSNHSALFVGRMLGGVSTTLLYTVFETWMVAEYHRLGFGHSDTALSSIYGTMSILSGMIATFSGLVAQLLENISMSAPFIASIVCLGLAATLITNTWVENYGNSQPSSVPTLSKTPEKRTEKSSLLALGAAMSFLEGSMYMVIYSWSRTIISARELAHFWSEPPFGIIYGNLMCAMTLGSFFFKYTTRHGNAIQTSSLGVQLATSISSLSLLLLVSTEAEIIRFWALCIFEFCLGAYFPGMAYLRGNLIGNDQRGKVYGLMRIPVNAFAVIALLTVDEGERSREDIIIVCSGMLLVATFFMARYIPQPTRGS